LKTKNINIKIPAPQISEATIGAKTPNGLKDDNELAHVVPMKPVTWAILVSLPDVVDPITPSKKFAIPTNGTSNIHSKSCKRKVVGLELKLGNGG